MLGPPYHRPYPRPFGSRIYFNKTTAKRTKQLLNEFVCVSITLMEPHVKEIILEAAKIATELGHQFKDLSQQELHGPKVAFFGWRTLSRAARASEVAQTQGLLSFSFILNVGSVGCSAGATICEGSVYVCDKVGLKKCVSAFAAGSFVLSSGADRFDQIFFYFFPATLFR